MERAPDMITNIHVYVYTVVTHSMPLSAIASRNYYRTRRPELLSTISRCNYSHSCNANDQLAVNFAMKGCPFQVKATVLIVPLELIGVPDFN